jgi:hypothetical protein
VYPALYAALLLPAAKSRNNVRSGHICLVSIAIPALFADANAKGPILSDLRCDGSTGPDGAIRCSVLCCGHVFPPAIFRALVAITTGRADAAT